MWAIALGTLSSASLPLGSAVGLLTRLKPFVVSILAAFGAGALIAALTVELVAPTLFALHDEFGGSHGGDPYLGFYALVAGAVAGGIVYVLLDQVVNAHGGFLRKTATTITYIKGNRVKRQRELLEQLSGFSLLRNVPPEHVSTLVSMVRPVRFADGDAVARQGDEITEAVFILKGRIRVTARGREVGSMGPGQVFGLATIVLKIPSLGDGIADSNVAGLSLSAANFERLRELSPEFNQACLDLTEERLKALENEISSRREKATEWIRHAAGSLRTGAELPSSDQLRRARQEHHGAPLAIWLGILLDGIPESFVIGSGLLVALAQFSSLETVRFGQIIPYTLIAGLFLSNFPEALASSANMRLQGWGRGRIFMLWVSLMVITAVGAGLGYLLAGSLSHTVLVFAEGLAAGAMLTMIAAAMIPEAVHQGDANAVGLSTLAGFLAAVSFKLLE